MSQDPYNPPATKDLTPPLLDLPTRPAAIKTACLLFCVTYCLSLLTMMPGIRKEPFLDSALSWVVMVVFMLMYTAFFAWLLKATLDGKNWGRWAILLLWLLCMVAILPDMPQEMLKEPLATRIDVLAIAIDLYSFSLLFFSVGGQWFAACKAARS